MKINIINTLKKFSRYELVAFTTGFVLMSYELIASRMLGPSIGSSMYVWTAVIGIMIFALAIGYTVGGFVADKRVNKNDVAVLLVLSAVLILINIFTYNFVLDNITNIFLDTRTQAVIATIFLFIPVSFLLGMASPYLARLRVKSINNAGQSVALLSASNSLGGIAGTFATGFVFFAFLNIIQGLALLIFILVVSALFMITKLNSKQLFTAFIILLIIFIIVIFKNPYTYAQYDTLMASYKVRYITKNQREVALLVMGPSGYQSGAYIDGNKDLVFSYTQKIANLVENSPNKQNILILGGGAYTLPEYLANKYPKSNITVVEIDDQLEQIAKDHFRYEPKNNITNITQDARIYLNNNKQQYDIIIVDIYSDSSVPFSLATKEYSDKLSNSTTKEGVIIANVIGATSDSCISYFSGIDKNYKSNFTNAKYFPLIDSSMHTKQNIIIVYSNTSLSWTGLGLDSYDKIAHMVPNFIDIYSPVEHLQNQCK